MTESRFLSLEAQHRLIKQVLNEAPHASEAYISVESRAPMILRTFADDPQACFFV